MGVAALLCNQGRLPPGFVAIAELTHIKSNRLAHIGAAAFALAARQAIQLLLQLGLNPHANRYSRVFNISFNTPATLRGFPRCSCQRPGEVGGRLQLVLGSSVLSRALTPVRSAAARVPKVPRTNRSSNVNSFSCTTQGWGSPGGSRYSIGQSSGQED